MGREVDVDAVLQGAVDLHVHPGPSPFPRRFGIAEAAREAAAAGFRTIAVKSHHHSMVTDVMAIQDATGPLPLSVLAGVTLNGQVGGFNPSAVELALSLGGRIVWFPTIAAANHIAQRGALHSFPNSTIALGPDAPVQVRGDDGALRPVVLECLALIRDADAVLACGHLSADEIDLVIEAALRMGVRRIVVNHPNFVIGASPARCGHWASLGVYVEHSLCQYDPRSSFCKWDLEVLGKYVDAVGSDRSILSSDLGQVGNPTPVQAFRAIVPRLLDAGHPLDTVRRLVSTSAQTLID